MRLKRGLGLIHVFSIASGAMPGLFILPGIAQGRAGPAVWVAYVLAGLLAAAGLLSTAELATAMPKAGGDYYFITRGMGAGVGTVAGLLNWSFLSLKSAFALFGMAMYVKLAVSVDWRVTGLVLCALVVGLNLVGAREAARVQVVLVAVLLALLGWYVGQGVGHVDVRHFEHFAPHGLGGVFAAAGFVFVSYGGLMMVASVAGEVKTPGRVIPVGLLLSLAAMIGVYALVVFVTTGVLSGAKMVHSLTPISDAAGAFMGSAGWVALAVAATVAFLTTANGGIMAGSRYLLAMSHDRLLPASLGRLADRSAVPYVATLVTGGVVAAALLLNVEALVEGTSTALILNNMLSCVSIIVLRKSGLQNYRPRFRAPLFPWVQIAGLAGLAFMIFEMGAAAWLISGVLILVGIGVYLVYGRAQSRRESALLHLVQRLTARELVTGTLENELKEVIRERDEIVLDRFDHLIENCLVLDVKGPTDSQEFFARVGDSLAPRLGADRGELLEALLAREKESSTVLSPHLAIPHVVIAGQQRFDILLARCREGIAFSYEAPSVQSVFVLAGSKDERNFHLRCLSAIAQIVQSPRFLDRWLAAGNAQALRDVVLLGERQRL